MVALRAVMRAVPLISVAVAFFTMPAFVFVFHFISPVYRFVLTTCHLLAVHLCCCFDAYQFGLSFRVALLFVFPCYGTSKFLKPRIFFLDHVNTYFEYNAITMPSAITNTISG